MICSAIKGLGGKGNGSASNAREASLKAFSGAAKPFC